MEKNIQEEELKIVIKQLMGFHCMHSPKFTIHRIREISPKSSLLSHLDQVNSRRIDYGVLISMALQ